jgi:DNA polymerase III epsilon subunit-like protein
MPYNNLRLSLKLKKRRNKMSFVVVDVESDGPIPSEYSMVSFGAVIVEPTLTKTFYGKVKPVSDKWIPEALAVSEISREEHMTFDSPEEVMEAFAAWLKENSSGKPVFCSDNVAFDWQFINYYFHKYFGSNPFGWSGRRIGDIYCGLVGNASKNHDWKRKYRKTKHTHNPVDDAMGNAEAMLAFKEELGLKIGYK